jgi:hypothetical protein
MSAIYHYTRYGRADKKELPSLTEAFYSARYDIEWNEASPNSIQCETRTYSRQDILNLTDVDDDNAIIVKPLQGEGNNHANNIH